MQPWSPPLRGAVARRHRKKVADQQQLRLSSFDDKEDRAMLSCASLALDTIIRDCRRKGAQPKLAPALVKANILS